MRPTVEELRKFLHEKSEQTTKRAVSSWEWRGTRVYVVSKEKAGEEDFRWIRESIVKETGASDLAQIMGSSSRLNEKVTDDLDKSLPQMLKDNVALLYGVTGYEGGVNSVVNRILQKSEAESRKLFVWNLVDDSLKSIKEEELEALPGTITYLFGKATYLDGNELSDALSNYSVLAGGGGCAADQVRIAVEVGKIVRTIVLKEGSIQVDGDISAGEAICEVKKLWMGHPPDTRTALEILKSLHKDWKEDGRLKMLPGFLDNWKKMGLLKKIKVKVIE